MHAFALNCTLKPSPEASSTDHLLDRLTADLDELDVKLDRARVVDHDVRAGVRSDEGVRVGVKVRVRSSSTAGWSSTPCVSSSRVEARRRLSPRNATR